MSSSEEDEIEIEDEGTEEFEDFDEELNIMIPDEEDTQEEGGDEDDSVLDEITKQVAMLGSSLSEVSILEDSLLIKIFHYLTVSDLLQASRVCLWWRKVIIGNDSFWKPIYHSLSAPIATYLPIPTYYERFILHCERKSLLNENTSSPSDILNRVLKNQKIEEWQLDLLVKAPSFVPELQCGEPALLDLLQEKWVIKGLLDIMLRPSKQYTQDNLRLCHISFQTLASNLLIDEFIGDSSLLDVLFYYLETVNRNDQPTPSSAYFSKLVTSLFENRGEDIIKYCKQHLRILRNLLENIQNPYLMEMLYKFVDSDISHQWLVESKLLSMLISQLSKEESISRQESIVDVLLNILTLCQPWGQTPLVTSYLNDSNAIKKILDYTVKEPLSEIRLKLGLKVLVGSVQLISEDLADVPLLVTHITTYIPFFNDTLIKLANNNGNTVKLQHGEINLFGFARMQILDLFTSLMCTGFPIVTSVMETNNVFNTLLDIFFHYKWNNLIHNQVTQIFFFLLYCNNHEIMKNVIENCNLLKKIVDAHNMDEGEVGYLGHLRDIANEMITVAGYSPIIADLMEENLEWTRFATNELDRMNKLEGKQTGTGGYYDDDDYEDIDILSDPDNFGADDYEEYEIDVDDNFESDI